ncbi:type II toxin-antitoxin system Phd/YefM family antitoxin [Pseudonocardia sp. CA-142604]|uniref:type II toxin-antitoxin system Phd/YefM family antitoxin n=1 Tax=Pseudonocardia sp. CA-142604 TaxID=3240024 RepID=UPI003D8FE688
MVEVGVHEAKTTLSDLLRRVAEGEEVVITRSGEPVARLVPVQLGVPRVLGRDAGLFEVPADFDEPSPNTCSEPSIRGSERRSGSDATNRRNRAICLRTAVDRLDGPQ